jgi:phage terminase small subunit
LKKLLIVVACDRPRVFNFLTREFSNSRGSMGQRGKLPATISEQTPLNDLNPPDWLGKEARKYWRKHCQLLAKSGLLVVETAESFAVHCDLWERLQSFRGQPTTRAYLDTYSRFQSSSKMFRLLPTEKPAVAVDHRGQIAAEFDDEGF